MYSLRKAADGADKGQTGTQGILLDRQPATLMQVRSGICHLVFPVTLCRNCEISLRLKSACRKISKYRRKLERGLYSNSSCSQVKLSLLN